jgi:predicted NAD/FAD-dependent oxidoreductase
VNAHYKIDPPPGQPPILGIINGTMEWLFAFPGRLSVTISGADRLIATPREELAEKIWSEIQSVTKIESPLPAWQIIKEKRATFAATPAEEARRPSARSVWTNLIIAGDWTNTGLPATIEGAIRSGFTAADAVLADK